MTQLTLIETKEMTFDDLIRNSGYTPYGFVKFSKNKEYYCPEQDDFYTLQNKQNLEQIGFKFEIIPLEKYRLLLLTGGICALNPST